jgi:chaperonin GroEL
MAKELRFDAEARELLRSGVDKLANTIRTTLGPKGRNVILEKITGTPTVTNDGVTIAREIHLKNVFENMGAQVLKEAAIKNNDIAGDGTTTATVLAQAIVREGMSAIAKGANPMLLRRGIGVAVNRLLERLQELAHPVSSEADLARVAAISANDDDEIGAVIASALHTVGQEGTVTVEESPQIGMSVDFVEGYAIENGFVSPYLVTDPARLEAVLDDPYIVLSSQKISKVQELMPLLEKVMRERKPFLVIAETVDGPALSMLVHNHVNDMFTSCAVRAPKYGDRRLNELEDIAAVVGGTVVSKQSSKTLATLEVSDLGRARQVRVTAEETTIIDGAGKQADIDHRAQSIRAEQDRATNPHDQDVLAERLGRLTGKVGVISVGAATPAELKEIQHRVEDALSATRAAVAEGIVAGGGAALVHIEPALEDLQVDGDYAVGVEIVRRALAEPAYWIAANAGYVGETVVEQIRRVSADEGFNALTGEFANMVSSGVIDPLQVTRSALQNGASVAALLLTTNSLVAEEQQQFNPALMTQFGQLDEGLEQPSPDASTPQSLGMGPSMG